MRTLGYAALVGIVSCAAGGDPRTDRPERQGGEGGDEGALTAPALRALRSAPRASSLLDEAGPLGDGTIDRGGLHATLPRSSAAPLVLFDPATGARAEIFADVERSDVPARAAGAVRVLVDASPGVDVVHVAAGAAIEELRVLRDARAPGVLRWRVRVNPAVSAVRAREGRVELVTRDGWVAIASAPMWAQDARGVTRDVSVTVARAAADWVVEARLDDRDLSRPIVVDPAWSAGPAMSSPRRSHAVVALSSTRFLVIGGSTSAGALSTCEIYDASTNTFSATGSMATPRTSMGATRLADGRVLVGGGQTTSGNTANAEIFTPSAGTWSAAGTLQMARHSLDLVRLTSGKVLAVGGYPYGPTGVCDLFDPALGTWKPAATMAFERGKPAVQLLSNGKVLVAGGWFHGPTLSTAELYDPATDTFAPTGSMSEPRHFPASAVLASGKVLVFGGSGIDGYSASSDLYDPATGKFTAGPKATIARTQAFVATLTTGRVLVGGGYVNGNGATLYDPISNTFLATPSLASYRDGAAAAPLASGRAIVIGGGSGSTVHSTTELYGPAANGATCTVAGDCLSGFCASGVCCNAACTGYTCTTGACTTSCASDAACASGYYCNGSACVAKKASGAASACGRAAECAAGFCVDGYCCNTACTGQCAACDVAGALGTCSPVKGAPHGSRPACGGTGAGTVCGRTCDGASTAACTYASASTPCGANTCSGGVEAHQSLCDGAGSCPDVPTSCGAYACGATACRSTCTTSAQCAANHYCAGGVCFAKLGLGTECASGETCATGFCTDGVCCDVASCGGGGSSCAVAGKLGTCTKTIGTACAKDDECGSGRCVDGTCCESACAGQCEACDVPGKLGKCVAIAGEPHGGRTACDDGAGDPCKARSCDGEKDRATCVGYRNGPAVSCAPAKCEGTSFAPSRTCDGAGSCRAFAPIDCAPFSCDDKGCKTSCATSGDCASGFACEAGACVPKAQCTTDALASIGKDGARTECLPYRCDTASGTCASSCVDSSGCVGGYVCDVTRGTCVAVAGAGDDGGSGGCSSGRATSVGAGWWILGAIAAWAARRRVVRAAPLTLLLLASLGCRSEAPREPAATGADRVVRSLRAWPGLSLPEARAGVRLVDVQLPARATTPLRIAVHDRPDASLEIVGEHAADVPGDRVDGGVVYRDADPATDVVVLEDGATVEELRVLRDARAPTTARFRLHRGPAIAAMRLREGRIEAVGEAGRVELVAPPPYAVDARGERRALHVSLDHDALALTVDTGGLTFPVVVDPAWTTSAPMGSPRQEHAAVSLADGRVLVAGGWDGGYYLSTAEIYDPKTNTWTATGSMATPRSIVTGIRLASGKVMAIGGYNPTSLDTAEVWDPATGAWTPTLSPMKRWRRGARATLLPTGNRVLVVGGTDYAMVDLYDPAQNKFNAPVNPPDAPVTRQGGHNVLTLTTGPNAGGAFVFGGPWAAYSTAEIYDAASNNWKVATPPTQGRNGAMAFAMPDGRVVVTGDLGPGYIPSSSTEIYNPVTGTWSAGPALPGARHSAEVVGLGFGRFLVVGGSSSWTGGSSLSTAAIWESATSTWRTVPSMATRRQYHRAAAFPVAGVPGAYEALVTGGLANTGVVLTVASTERFALLSNGAVCTAAGECNTNICASGLCCATACAAPYRCNGGTCPTKCASDDDCATGYWCSSTVCVAKKANGVACGAGRECTSTFCVDGVCCNSGCRDGAGALLQCGACNVTGKVGTCSPVVGAPPAGRAACFGAGVGTTCGPSCNGVDTTRCNLAATTVSCSSTACAAGVETHLSKCDGKGKCLDVPNACGAYACGASSCKTSCAASTDCAAGFYCNAGACVPVVGLGKSCIDASSCASGTFCTEGVCCAEASCGAGKTCASERKRGTCAKSNGESCAADDECASAVCADGVCCDSACRGQCQACDVPGKVGTCAPVSGAPRGARPACGAAGPDVCQQLACDGARDPEKCVAFAAGDAVECRASWCGEGAVFHETSRCDGAGSCLAGEARTCAPYGCDGAGCKTACTSHADCAKGNVCAEAKCVAEGSCTADGLSSIGADGVAASCAPYRCRSDGRCGSECARTEDCAPGAVCDSAAKRCVVHEASEDSGGCAMGGRRAASQAGSGGAVGAVLLALALLRRPRRRPGR
ncbi:MAG: hypothetical protein HYV09_10570 [Deltaproteobacteria bacterium]|nr:hypothetical protein [Deltaproteobacteria bacterium]